MKQLSANDLKTVSCCFLFKGESDAFVLRAVSDEKCEIAGFKKGEIIFDRHDFRRCIGIILSGRVHVSNAPEDGKRFLMNTLENGGIFGAAAVFSDEPDYVTVLTAASACRVLFLPQQLLTDLMRESTAVMDNYLRFLSGRIHFLNAKIQGLTSSSAVQALARHLAGLADCDSGSIILKTGLSSLADTLNLGRASLYRAFDALEAVGAIKRNGKNIDILDAQTLASYQ